MKDHFNARGMSMRSIVPCATLSVSVFIGLFAGCAPATTRTESPDQSLVTAEDLEKNPHESIESVLQRKVPGLVVTRTADGGIVLQIRGISSFKGENTPPLYVLDNLPIEPGPDGALTGLNPYDIESIKVLKGADAAMYGIQGANGVIVITSKKPASSRP
jgi:TonB-dependent SusC/RagA subfamily outer membrane receptor